MNRPLSTLLIAALTLGFSCLGTAKNVPGEGAEAGAKKFIAEQLLGYWMFDTKKTLAAMTKAALKEAGIDELDEKQRKEMEEQVAEMAKELVLEFKPDGAATAHEEDGPEDAKHKILKPDEATGKFEMSVDHGGGDDGNSAKCLIEGDHLRFMPDDVEMQIHLKRLTKAQAKKQIAKIQKGAKKPEEDKGRE